MPKVSKEKVALPPPPHTHRFTLMIAGMPAADVALSTDGVSQLQYATDGKAMMAHVRVIRMPGGWAVCQEAVK